MASSRKLLYIVFFFSCNYILVNTYSTTENLVSSDSGTHPYNGSSEFPTVGIPDYGWQYACQSSSSLLELSEVNGVLSSPYFGNPYPPYATCQWRIDSSNSSSYAQAVVLKKFSLKIPGGTMVALCGLSGGGKSTVAALLERFYDLDTGKITLDGVNINSLDPSWLRGRVIGFINQEPVLFATTVLENIRYGRLDATDKEVEEAARLANAHDFISSFPDGYMTILGERGVTVSGGQKQRIAIARALLKNPAILILDEATSALDAESERIVQEALDRVVKNRTVLVIAHRLSTIKKADFIAVMAGGQVKELGNHDDLKGKQGIYWRLIRQQESERDKGV